MIKNYDLEMSIFKFGKDVFLSQWKQWKKNHFNEIKSKFPLYLKTKLHSFNLFNQKEIQWELCKKLKFGQKKQMVYTQARIRPGEWDAQNSLGFWDTNESPNLGQTTRPSNNQQQQQREFAELWIFLSQLTTE